MAAIERRRLRILASLSTLGLQRVAETARIHAIQQHGRESLSHAIIAKWSARVEAATVRELTTALSQGVDA